jgi:hypothetical protein
MTDIVERLREGEGVDGWWFRAEAANEIERLRAENEMLKSNLPARAATRGLAEQHNEITILHAENEKLRDALIDAAGELQHAYIMGFTERYRYAARAARNAVAAIRERRNE